MEDARFRAFLEGFEANDIDRFLATATVEDCREFGKLCAELGKQLRRDSDALDVIVERVK